MKKYLIVISAVLLTLLVGILFFMLDKEINIDGILVSSTSFDNYFTGSRGIADWTRGDCSEDIEDVLLLKRKKKNYD